MVEESRDVEAEGDFQVSLDGKAVGYAVRTHRPDERLVVELLADGLPIALLRADRFDETCARKNIGDGCYGFGYQLPDAVLTRARQLEARLANTAIRIGSIIDDPGGQRSGRVVRSIGLVRWDSGLRIRGWIDPEESDEAPQIVARWRGSDVAQAFATGWSFETTPGEPRAVRTFVLDLPRTFADGRVHEIDVAISDGRHLPGSPCCVFALADALADLIEGFAELESERPRARLLDRLWPQTVPFTLLNDWLRRFQPTLVASPRRPRVRLIIIGADGSEAIFPSLDQDKNIDVSVSILAACNSPVEFDEAQFFACVDAVSTDCDLFVLTVSGVRLEAGSLARLANAALSAPPPSVVYSDILIEGEDRRWPIGYPAYDDELSLEQGYGALFFAVAPRALAHRRGGCDNLYAVFASACDAALLEGVGPLHIADLLATLPWLPPAELEAALQRTTVARLAARSVDATVTTSSTTAAASVRVQRVVPPSRISIIVAATCDDAGHLAASRAAFAASGRDIILVDGSAREFVTPGAVNRDTDLDCTVVRLHGCANVSRLLNAGAERATGDVLLFVAAGSHPVEPDWDVEMLGRLAAGSVGVVGGVVVSSSSVVRHAGYTLGPRCEVAARFVDRLVGDPGYGGWLGVAHQCSAVSSAFMMTPRRVFEAVGGFDAVRFSLHYADVDYCLRVATGGQRTLLTPHAQLLCDIADPLPPEASSLKALAGRERALLQQRWSLVPGCDPFYSPWLSMGSVPYSGLGWPPVKVEPRLPSPPTFRTLHPGF